MTKLIAAALVGALLTASAPAMAAPQAAAPAAAPGKLSVQTSKINDIIKVPAAKAALEKALPPIADYYGQIGDSTLAEVQPMSQGALTDEMMKTLQEEFNKL